MVYGRTKALAMQEVLEADGNGLETIVCCPTGFVGVPDYRMSPSGRLVVDFLERRLPAYVDGGFDFVDVRDVADGVIRAGRSGKAGRTYLLSGNFVTVPRLMELLEDISGVKKPGLCLPARFVLPFAPLVEIYYRMLRKAPRFTRYSLRLLLLGAEVDSSRARLELGFSPRPIEESMADSVAWFSRASQ
jgi:dihydroflavonol-4-reductase